MNVICPNCGLTVGEQFGGKLLMGATAALVGGRISPAAALIAGVIGAVLGHYIIDSQIRKCPQCGLVIRIVDGLI